MKEYDYPAYGFAVSFPAPPQETDQPSDGKVGEKLILESTASGGRDFVVESFDLGRYFAFAGDSELNKARQGAADKIGATASSDTPITMGAYSGHEYQLSKDGKPVMVLREFLIGSKVYILGAASGSGVTDPAIAAYFGSFRVLPPPAATNAT
jgi:hypothetical protein